MWTHTSWQGRFLPQPLPAEERLRSYATWCNAVEGNTTFYATPKRSTVETWAQQTGPDFRFVLKLPKSITHERRLIDGGGFRFSERRHRAFFEDPRALEGVLAGIDAEWIPFDTTAFFQTPPTSDAERETWMKKPRMPRRSVALTAHPIIRYLGRDSASSTIEGWRPWIDTVIEWLREGRTPTMFIHTPNNADAPMLARRFHEDVRARLPELEPLPEPPPVEPLTLF